MRKAIAQLDQEQREALLYLVDLCIAMFSATLGVGLIKTVVDLI
jgi:hypothetical protein